MRLSNYAAPRNSPAKPSQAKTQTQVLDFSVSVSAGRPVHLLLLSVRAAGAGKKAALPLRVPLRCPVALPDYLVHRRNVLRVLHHRQALVVALPNNIQQVLPCIRNCWHVRTWYHFFFGFIVSFKMVQLLCRNTGANARTMNKKQQNIMKNNEALAAPVYVRE